MMARRFSTTVLCLATLTLMIWIFSSAQDPTALAYLRSRPSSDNILDTQNATLGFQKIFVISLPGRTDKRDAMVLGAFYSGLDIEFVDAVVGTDVPLTAYPQDWRPEETTNSIGTWRAHMNVYQRMVHDKIQTALIMEDDADWDVMLKSQMLGIAQGARHIQQSTNPKHSPYGDEWDAFFLGHCGTNNRINSNESVDQRYWVINNDPTVIPPQHNVGVRSPDQSPLAISKMDNHTRIIFSPYKVTCLQAYGVTLSGATRILYDQAFRPHANVIDIAWSTMCKYRRLRMPIAVHPPIMGQHRPPGDGSKDSDRTDHKNRPRSVGYSENVNFPVRLNLESLMDDKELVVSQYPGETIYDAIDPKNLKLPEGKAVVVTKEDFEIPSSDG